MTGSPVDDAETPHQSFDPAGAPQFFSGANPLASTASSGILAENYDELRRLAAFYLSGECVEHTLQRTALVHEAYLRLLRQEHVEWKNRAHFVGIFARLMRQTLISHAIARKRLKRGGPDPMQVTLEFYEDRAIDVTAVDEALAELEALDPRQAQIVELRFFAGFTIEEIGEALGISPATVKREWAFAKVWLRRELTTDS